MEGMGESGSCLDCRRSRHTSDGTQRLRSDEQLFFKFANRTHEAHASVNGAADNMGRAGDIHAGSLSKWVAAFEFFVDKV
jgi:hypothetical protein